MIIPSPIADVRASLTADRERLREAVDQVPTGARETKPEPGRWSAAEVLEHLAVVETRVVMMLGPLVQTAPSMDAAPSTGTPPLDRTPLLNRQTRVEAPPQIQPTGTVSAADAWASLQNTRAQLLTLLDTIDAERRDLTQVSRQHPVLGPLDGYQWIAAVGGHEARHALQILEIAKTIEHQQAS
jgi:DinB superfamily